MSKNHGGVSALGGWLYADLMLILFIGVLSQVVLKPAQKLVPTPTPTVTPTATPTASPTPSATVTSTPRPSPTVRPTSLARVSRDYVVASLRSTPSADGAIQGELNPDSFVYIVEQDGEWASVVITTYVSLESLRDPSDPSFRTPIPPTETPTVFVPVGPTPTATALPSLSRERIEILVPIASGLSQYSSPQSKTILRDAVIKALSDQLERRNLPTDSTIGMVLSFGGAPRDQPEIGNDASQRLNLILEEVLWDSASDSFTRAGFESFHSFSVPVGQVQLWVYVYVN
jgi:hypothetical protein